MGILKLDSLNDIDPRIWGKYGMRFENGQTFYRVMTYEFSKEDVISIIDYGGEIEIETDKAKVMIGKKLWKLEVEYKL